MQLVSLVRQFTNSQLTIDMMLTLAFVVMPFILSFCSCHKYSTLVIDGMAGVQIVNSAMHYSPAETIQPDSSTG